MDSGYSEQDRENSSGGSSSSTTNASTSCLLSPRPTTSTAAGSSATQVVLEEVVSDDYQPTEEEQREYAVTIGIDPDTELELMHLALEGLRAPLPQNWRPVQVSGNDAESKEELVYYFNFQTRESSWEHPCDEQFRQLVSQERARLRRARRQRSGVRFQDSTSVDDSTLRAKREPTVAEVRTRVAADEERLLSEMRKRLDAEEERLRLAMRERLKEEEAELRVKLRGRLNAERQEGLKRLELEADEIREEQRRLLELEAAEKRVDAVARMTEMRAEIDQLKRAKAELQKQLLEQPLPDEQQQVDESQALLRAKPRCSRLRIQRGISVDEGATVAAAAAAVLDDNAGTEEEQRIGSMRGTGAIGRARDFLNRHLSAERGFRGAVGQVSAPESAEQANSSRKRPQLLRACRSGSGSASKYSVDSALDAAEVTTVADATKPSEESAAPEALAAELRKLRCSSLPSLAAGPENEESCSETSEQPRAKQGHISINDEATHKFPSHPQPQPPPAIANNRPMGHHGTRGRTTPSNPRRQRLDWRKMGDKSDSQQSPDQQQSTELKLAQHRAWLSNYARLNGLPPSGGNLLMPQG